ncbi:MAG: ABC transporter permease [Deltaproteobacteria bacterium]|nr:ABC transporter permease [Deltaproteobacteria bacterium]
MPGIIRQLIRDTKSQKLRIFLTLFGMIWGTTAVSLLLAFGDGFHQQLAKQAAGIGNGVVIGWPSRTSIPYDGLNKGRYILVDDEDINLIRKKAVGLGFISSEYQSGMKLQYGTKILSVGVTGIEPEYGEIRNLIPQAGGRFINPFDIQLNKRVLFIGNELAEQVFGNNPPVGRTLNLNGSPFLVAGVMKKKEQNSSYNGSDKDKVFIPATTFKMMTGQKHVGNLVFTATDVDKTGALITDVRHTLAARHRFSPGDEEAVGFWDTSGNAKFINTIMLAFRIFLGMIGCLTMVVGGIGISNIMNVVVEERTREIGIKMALGAKPRFILGQFMIETLSLSIAGGITGIIITYIICMIFPVLHLSDTVGDPRLSLSSAAATALVLGLISFISGWFPARTAANLDPVTAMKM